MKRLIAEEEKQIIFSQEDVNTLREAAEKEVSGACKSAEEKYSEWDSESEEITEDDIVEYVYDVLTENYPYYFGEALEKVLAKYVGSSEVEKVADNMLYNNISSLSVALGYKPNDFETIGQLLEDFGDEGWSIDASDIASAYNEDRENTLKEWEDERKEEERDYYDSVRPSSNW